MNKRKVIAETLEVSGANGCGCCSMFTETAEQEERAKEWEVDLQSVFMADEILAALEETK